MAPRNEHISNLGFRLTSSDSLEELGPLLKACDMQPLPEVDTEEWSPSRYLLAKTRAGGVAACVGWNRGDDNAVVHSLAVAPSSRRSGVGASLFATAVGHLMDADPVERIYLASASAEDFFVDFGFHEANEDDVPDPVRQHPLIQVISPEATTMVRRYDSASQRGLDQCAFRLVHNTTPDDVLPPGSVFFFRQSGNVIEANYRGEPVVQGHLIGYLREGRFRFLWHQFVTDRNLLHGEGEIQVRPLDDGRRELREQLGDDPGELLLREV